MDSDSDIEAGSGHAMADSESSRTPSQHTLSTDAEEYEAERAAEFEEDTRRVSRNIIFLHQENVQLQQGKGRTQVSGICGQLMRSHAEPPLDTLRDRLEPRLPASARLVLNSQLTLLHRQWRRDLPPNDRIFVDAIAAWSNILACFFKLNAWRLAFLLVQAR